MDATLEGEFHFTMNTMTISRVPVPSAPTHAPDVKRSSFKGELAGKGSATTEAVVGMLAGMVYGATSPLAGHPFDTVKTKMQAQASHRNCSSMDVVRYVYRTEGVRGFYRGLLPALTGGSIFGGIVLGAYGGTFAACEGTVLAEPIPGTGGLRGAVVAGGIVSAASRSVIETPLALMKIRRQTGQSWLITPQSQHSLVNAGLQLKELYKGMGPTFWRSTFMLGTFFILNDYAVRLIPDVVNAPVVGPFVKGGVCATIGWLLAWPIEVVKSRVQADSTSSYSNKNTIRLIREIVKEEGLARTFRGIGPGICKSFVSNGAAMFMFHFLHEFMEEKQEKSS
eukprot:766494-Hanusia_phi.AAC.4